MIKDILIFNEYWEVKDTNLIGKGAFSEIYAVRNIQTQGFYAMKIQNPNFESNVLRWESEVLTDLSDCPLVPKLYYHGTSNTTPAYEYLVMELLSGGDMATIRDKIRKTNATRLIQFSTATYFALQILQSIEILHKKGYVHRDIKPSNFIRRNINSTEFCVIDFGIAKQYKNKEGVLKLERDTAEFRGTTQYASPFVHEGYDQCPRDDLFSLLFVFIDLLCGGLPWTEAAKAKDKPKVATLKLDYINKVAESIDWIMKTIETQSSSMKDTQHKGFLLTEDAKLSLKQWIEYLKNLQYDSKPDYVIIRNYLERFADKNELKAISHVSYHKDGMSWKFGNNKLQLILKPLVATMDQSTMVKSKGEVMKDLLVETMASTQPRGSQLHRMNSHSLIEYSSPSNLLTTPRSYEKEESPSVLLSMSKALKDREGLAQQDEWMALQSDLCTQLASQPLLPDPLSTTSSSGAVSLVKHWMNLTTKLIQNAQHDPSIHPMHSDVEFKRIPNLDTLEYFQKVLEENQYFFGESDIEWKQWVELQKTVAQFNQLKYYARGQNSLIIPVKKSLNIPNQLSGQKRSLSMEVMSSSSNGLSHTAQNGNGLSSSNGQSINAQSNKKVRRSSDIQLRLIGLFISLILWII